MKTKTNLLATGILLGAIYSSLGQPVITQQPQSQTNLAGTTATFSVEATGAEPLSYQWRSHANAISFTNIPFGTAATLTLTNVQPTTRQFAVVVTDSGGLSATSSPLVTLTTLVPPNITNQPSAQTAELGASAILTVGVVGTAPLIYQWRRDGSDLSDKTNSSLVLTNLDSTHAGSYSVVVTNNFGTNTSIAASLLILPPVFTKITNSAVVGTVEAHRIATWGDYNNDGFIDLFVTTGVAGELHKNLLFRNNGDGSFTQITTGTNVNTLANSRGAAWADYDNDGWLDLFVATQEGSNYLFHNEGDGTFTRVIQGSLFRGKRTEPSNPQWGYFRGCSWGDFDGDGFVDLMAANQDDFSPTAGRNFLYQNNGDGTFTSAQSNLFRANLASWSACGWADVDNNNTLDLITASTKHIFYRNDGAGILTKTSAGDLTSGGFSSDLTWGDYNNDGWPDVFLTGGSIAEGPHTNSLYRNKGDGTFTLDLLNPVMRVTGDQFACAWGDFDNDGYLDLFVTNFDLVRRNALYRNNGDGTFHRLGSALFELDNSESYGCAWGDYDNDGFLDLVIANGSIATARNNFLYRNNGNTNHWLKVRCVGTAANRSGIGAKVRVLATIHGAARWQLQVIGGENGLGAQNGLLAHFGLGEATNVSTVRIEWPSGIVQTLTNVAPNQSLTVVEHQTPGPAGAPQITGVATAANGEVNLSIAGDIGLLYVLEASTNLLNWTKLAVRSNATGVVSFTDPKATNYTTRFYRVSIP